MLVASCPLRISLFGGSSDNPYFVEKYGYGSVKERDTDKRLDILWGMAFNNATRLVANNNEVPPKQKVSVIEEIMPEMFKIAKGLDDVLMQEQKQENKDDDLPF